MEEIDAQAWSEWLSHHPQAHILQTSEWGHLKSEFGWEPHFLTDQQCGAMVLLRKLPLGFHIAYIPKGPIGQNYETIYPAIDRLCSSKRVIFLKVEPDAWEGELEDAASLEKFAPIESKPIQSHRTVVIPLDGDENTWLKRMKQKTRYNIRLAEKNGVRVVESADVDAFSAIMSVTGERDGFGVHASAYYRRAYDLFSQGGQCAMLLAYYEDKPLAGLMVFKRGNRAWYLFGGSTNEERQRMPAYLIQWKAMRWAARNGCTEYDLWGAPDYDETYLEANFQERSDGLWGVYRFKRGFGGQVRRSYGARDRVYLHSIYRVYQWLMQRRQSPM